MIAGVKKAAAAKKALTDKRRGLRVINRCSPLIMLWANPRMRLPPLGRAAAFTTKTIRNVEKFRNLWPKISHLTPGGYHTNRGVSNELPCKNRPEVEDFSIRNTFCSNDFDKFIL